MRHAAKRASRLHVVQQEDVTRRAANVRVVEIESPRGQYIARSDAELHINRLVSPEERDHYLRAGERLGGLLVGLKAALRNFIQRLGSKSSPNRERSV